MISKKMENLVANSSAIRAMFEEGNRLAKIYGAENVFDFSLGNPNVPAPEAVKKAIIELLDEHNVEYGTAVVSSSTVILSALVQMVLPFIIMVVAMVFLFRFMSSKMGGGGLGGVGKANAKVYVEKKTGVTFKDVASS